MPGIRSSKSKYIVRLDSDDYVNRDFLSFLLQYIEQNSNTIYEKLVIII